MYTTLYDFYFVFAYQHTSLTFVIKRKFLIKPLLILMQNSGGPLVLKDRITFPLKTVKRAVKQLKNTY